MSAFAIRLLSPLAIGGRRLATGGAVLIDAGSAAELIRAGRAVLVDDADLERLIAVVGGRQAVHRHLAEQTSAG